MSHPDAFTRKLTELGGAVVRDESLRFALGLVASRSTQLSDACVSCGVSIIEDGTVSTLSTSDDRAVRLDQLQYDLMQGPCLAAIEQREAVRVSSFRDETRWPWFVERAISDGIVASYSVPICVGNEVVGSLNSYSSPATFTRADEHVGDEFARQAAMAVQNARTVDGVVDLVGQLDEAPQTRDVIGQAKGMLMARHDCTSDAAFDMLRTVSQRHNVKLRDLADQIVEARSRIDTS